MSVLRIPLKFAVILGLFAPFAISAADLGYLQLASDLELSAARIVRSKKLNAEDEDSLKRLQSHVAALKSQIQLRDTGDKSAFLEALREPVKNLKLGFERGDIEGVVPLALRISAALTDQSQANKGVLLSKPGDYSQVSVAVIALQKGARVEGLRIKANNALAGPTEPAYYVWPQLTKTAGTPPSWQIEVGRVVIWLEDEKGVKGKTEVLVRASQPNLTVEISLQ